MRAGVKIDGMTHEKTVAGRTHETATVGVDPAEGFKVNWAGQASPNVLRGSKLWQLPGELNVFIAASHVELPAPVQYRAGNIGILVRLGRTNGPRELTLMSNW
jgi:hypothetical protein